MLCSTGSFGVSRQQQPSTQKKSPSALCGRRNHASDGSCHYFQPWLSAMNVGLRKSKETRYETMISSYSVLIILLLVECCPANKRADPTSPPRGSGGKTTHISEFTDPATGLNPFLDLEEGRAGEMGRSIVEEKQVQPQPLPDSDLQLVEGGPNDRDRTRWNDNFGRRSGNFNNKPQHMIPTSRTSDVTSMERHAGNGKYDPFSASTEANLQVSPNIFMPSIRNSDEADYYSFRPKEGHNLDTDYSTEFHEVKEETAVIQEDSVHPQKVPVSKNILVSAAIAGASVAVIALLLAIYWWRQKMKRVFTRANANIADNTVTESIISDKANTNNAGIQKKSILA